MRRMNRVLIALSGLALVGAMAGCSPSTPTAAEQETASKERAYTDLIDKQPAEAMKYSPTRAALNEWVKKWGGEPGKLSYVYLFQTGNPAPLGYYVFKGLPVSYCTSLTPPEKWEYIQNGGVGTTKLPGIDGTYYSGQGCSQYFGIDAETGTMLEFGGEGISYLLGEAPLKLQAEPLGPSQIR